MTDTVYLYPKSSSLLSECKKSYPIPKNFIKTNLGVENCEVSPYFDCYYKAELKTEIQPRGITPGGPPSKGWDELNPQAYTSKMSPDFQKVPCKKPGCNDPSYISMDPRLFSSTRADYLILDRPPINGSVKLKNVYNKDLDNYGQGFTPYDQIKDGQIVYYIDNSIAGAFFEPVFSAPAKASLVLFKDPMGSIKPEANRTPLINTENPATTTPVSYPYCLSSIQDSQSQREDLISYQQRKNNEQKWTVRWT